MSLNANQSTKIN